MISSHDKDKEETSEC